MGDYIGSIIGIEGDTTGLDYGSPLLLSQGFKSHYVDPNSKALLRSVKLLNFCHFPAVTTLTRPPQILHS